MMSMMDDIQTKKKKMQVQQTDCQDIKWDFGSGDYQDLKASSSDKDAKSTKHHTSSKVTKPADDGLFDDLNEDDY